MMEQRAKKTEGKIPTSVSETLLAQVQEALQTIASWCKPIRQ
jgi:hypothetical protein